MIAELFLDPCTGELQMYVTPGSDTEYAMMAQHAHRFGMSMLGGDISYRTKPIQVQPAGVVAFYPDAVSATDVSVSTEAAIQLSRIRTGKEQA